MESVIARIKDRQLPFGMCGVADPNTVWSMLREKRVGPGLNN
jgi:hypothetical protein